ncbi:MAG: response regulator [Solirubrobacteraceae bacterium]
MAGEAIGSVGDRCEIGFLALEILIVDDSVVNQRVLEKILRGLGYEAALAGGGHEALEMLAVKPYDLVFMDIDMPDMDGLETTRQLRRAQQPDRRSWIVAVTARPLAQREECREAGMDEFLRKPARPAQIEALLRCLDPAPVS